MALVLFGVGGLVGNYVYGFLQDYWGRRPSFFVYLCLEIVACALSSIAWNFPSWLVFRVVVGLTVPAILASPYVLGNGNLENRFPSVNPFDLFYSHRIGRPSSTSDLYNRTEHRLLHWFGSFGRDRLSRARLALFIVGRFVAVAHVVLVFLRAARVAAMAGCHRQIPSCGTRDEDHCPYQ